MDQNEIFGIPTARAGVITDAPTITHVLENSLIFLLSIAGVVAIIAIVISGTLYLSAFGDPKKLALAKRSLTYAAIGLALALSALVITSQLSVFFS